MITFRRLEKVIRSNGRVDPTEKLSLVLSEYDALKADPSLRHQSPLRRTPSTSAVFSSSSDLESQLSEEKKQLAALRARQKAEIEQLLLYEIKQRKIAEQNEDRVRQQLARQEELSREKARAQMEWNKTIVRRGSTPLLDLGPALIR